MTIELSRRFVDGAWRYVAQEEAAGGGDPAAFPRGEYRFDSLIEAAPQIYTAEFVPHVNQPEGATLPLDLTDPQYPAVVEEGIYSIAASATLKPPPDLVDYGDQTDLWAVMSLTTDAFGFGWFAATAFSLNVMIQAGGGYGYADEVSSGIAPRATLTMTTYMPEGGTYQLEMKHGNPNSEMLFGWVIAVHRVA